MEIILIKEVPGLGSPGDIVTVKDGYARNHLFPEKCAVKKSPQSLKILETQKEDFQKMIEEKNLEYEKIMSRLEEIENFEIFAKAGESGKLFGSVTNKDVAEHLKEKYDIDLDKRQISLPSVIKTEGEYAAQIKLNKDFKKEFVFTVKRRVD